jgi:choloylglycine hydrolase
MCTGVRLIAQNGAVIYGRTLEFGKSTESNINIIPRNYSFTGTGPSGKQDGLQWKSRYALVGANALGVIGAIDGVNEKGLAGGLFYFPGYAEFQEVSLDETKNSIASWEILTWILTSFATVAQVRAALPTIKVNKAVLSQWGTQVPVHVIVHDAAGNSLVIEYIKGELVMYDNPLGVITNSPSFDWHITNLKNYVHISAFNAEKNNLGPLELTPFGQGSGMLGLPGDFTPPARFVRAAFLSQLTLTPKTEDDARKLLFHILDFFDIPLGIVREKGERELVCECTQWTTGADLTHKKYYWHTYNNRNLQIVDLMRADLDADKPVIIQMEQKEVIHDLTK